MVLRMDKSERWARGARRKYPEHAFEDEEMARRARGEHREEPRLSAEERERNDRKRLHENMRSSAGTKLPVTAMAGGALRVAARQRAAKLEPLRLVDLWDFQRVHAEPGFIRVMCRPRGREWLAVLGRYGWLCVDAVVGNGLGLDGLTPAALTAARRRWAVLRLLAGNPHDNLPFALGEWEERMTKELGACLPDGLRDQLFERDQVTCEIRPVKLKCIAYESHVDTLREYGPQSSARFGSAGVGRPLEAPVAQDDKLKPHPHKLRGMRSAGMPEQRRVVGAADLSCGADLRCEMAEPKKPGFGGYYYGASGQELPDETRKALEQEGLPGTAKTSGMTEMEFEAQTRGRPMEFPAPHVGVRDAWSTDKRKILGTQLKAEETRHAVRCAVTGTALALAHLSSMGLCHLGACIDYVRVVPGETPRAILHGLHHVRKCTDSGQHVELVPGEYISIARDARPFEVEVAQEMAKEKFEAVLVPVWRLHGFALGVLMRQAVGLHTPYRHAYTHPIAIGYFQAAAYLRRRVNLRLRSGDTTKLTGMYGKDAPALVQQLVAPFEESGIESDKAISSVIALCCQTESDCRDARRFSDSEHGAMTGDQLLQEALRRRFGTGGTALDYEAYAEFLWAAKDKGSEQARFELAQAQWHGRGLPVDKAAAIAKQAWKKNFASSGMPAQARLENTPT